ncbi:Ig-like domain-containing protein, partial [Pseudomonas sp. NBRC 111123]
DGSYKAGDVLSFTVNGSEALQTGALAPRLVLDVGGVTRYATYVSGSGSSVLVFQYVVQAGDNDSNGIAVNSIDLRGEALTDLAGNDLNLALNGMGSTAGVLVDTTAPGASSIVRVDASPSSGDSVRFTVTFSEEVSGVDASDFNLVFGGSAAGSISSVTALDGHTYTVVVGGLSGLGSLRLDLANSGTGIL